MTERWRLVNGTELYDILEDRGQEHDIHADHPEVVETLRREYERWWDLVSVQFEEEIPISIGSELEKRVCLTSHDWRHSENPWGGDPGQKENNEHLVFDQSQVRKGVGQGGYHEIQVEQAGRYQIELRRWPEEDNRPIREGIADTDHDFREQDIQEKHHVKYKGGQALAFHHAHVRIDRVSGKCGPGDAAQPETVCSLSTEISDSDTCTVCFAELPSGPHHLTCWFEGEDGFWRGAYYVYVTKTD
jgi:hypothetical protein